MIKTYSMLLEELSDYADIDNKIARLVKSQDLIKLSKGLYETDKDTPGYVLAGVIYGPSYLSFEYALSYYGIIPEAVYTYTSATFEKGRTKVYTNKFGNYTYRDIPASAYPYEIKLITQGTYTYRIASKEKALCDKLYSLSPVSNKKELLRLLFDDLRIDETEFYNLDKNILNELCDLYKSKNLKLLKKVLR
ncbi:MAG: hypothetical protein ACI4U3_08905 [Traorella sp.]